MRLIKFICLLGFVLISSCQNVDKIEKPNHLLSKAEMKDLIYDMVLLDAAAGINDSKLNELDIEILEFLTKKYGIDSTELQQNILYYNLKFDENKEIYENAKDSIDKLKKAYDSIAEVRDSIKQLEKKKLDSIEGFDTISKNNKIESYGLERS